MTHQELHALYEQRIPHIEPLIRFKGRGEHGADLSHRRLINDLS